MFDANARSPLQTSAAIGFRGATVETATSPFFGEALAASDLWAPSTFDRCCSQDRVDGTFYPAMPGLRLPVRIDFIVLSSDVGVVDASYAYLFLDLHATKPDHVPTMCTIKLAVKATRQITKRRVVAYSRAATTDPAKRAVFASILQAMPLVHHCVEPSSHAHIAMQWILVAARTAFPLPPVPQRPQCLPTCVFDIVLDRKQLTQAAQRMRRLLALSGFRCFFAIWQSAAIARHGTTGQRRGVIQRWCACC